MYWRRAVVSLLLPAGLLLLSPTPAGAAANLELYGTFHAMGITVDVDAGDDPDLDAQATVQWRAGDSGPFHQGYPLARVSPTRFVGSLFWLRPGISHEVRIELSDPDGGPLEGVILQATASTRARIVLPQPTLSLHVSTSGSGTLCTAAAPCALAEGLSRVQAGEELVLHGGTYFIGGLSVPRSGGQDTPIVIRGAEGETAVLDGADPSTFVWTSQGGGVWSTTLNTGDTHLVMAGGQRLYPYQSLSDLQNLVWGIPGFYCDGTDLFVRLAGDADPNGESMLVSRESYAFLVEQDHIAFIGLVFQHFGQGSYPKALYLNNANGILVRGCTFAVNDLGIGIKRSSGENVIEHNEFFDTDFDWPWDAVKAGSGLETGGIRFYDPTTGRGNIIRHNVFHDYFDGFGACPGTAGDQTNETDVYGNLVYNAGDDGMETDGTCSNVRIWGNTFHDVLMGISLAPTYVGPTWAVRNLIYRTGVGNNSYSGSPFKFNSGYDASGPMYLFHNTADAALPGNNGLYVKAPGSWSIILSRNNIWSGTDYAINNYNTDQPIDLDWDDLHTTRTDEFVYWGTGGNRHMRDLATFRSLTGQELHGTDAAPGFRDPAAGDYELDESSQLVDAGTVLPGIDDRYAGAAPDPGALEAACRFDDVGAGFWSRTWITTLCRTHVTAGCSNNPPLYCPEDVTTRGQMAVFLLSGLMGDGFTPPPATGIFDDVPAGDPLAPWIEELAARGITAGCSGDPPLYCPDDAVTRGQMAVFLLTTEEGPGYTPPPATGVFDDVPAGHPFAPWIEELFRRHITSGCNADPPLYCPDAPVTRGQMAVFLVTTFDLAGGAPAPPADPLTVRPNGDAR